jgi:hypothetical protein
VEPEEPWQLPVELAVMPEVWSALLSTHVLGPDGRCRGCRSPVGPGRVWPCTLYVAAARARRIASGGPPTMRS